MNFWHLLFHFPDGGVYSNLVASLIWAVPTFSYTLYRIEKHHKEHMKELHSMKDAKKK